MKKISSTGEGLSVLIVCDNVAHHDWMTFATWYSINKMIPDAKISICCNRKPAKLVYFTWTKTCRVNMQYHNGFKKEQIESHICDKPLLIVEPDILMIREIDGGLDFLQTTENIWVNGYNEGGDLYCGAKEDKSAIFVSYADGWGRFVMDSWINKLGFPFQKSFGKPGMNSNEVKIEKMWGRLGFLFPTVTRG